MPGPVEIAGFVFGVAGVWLTIKEHWLCFPVGLVNVSVSLFLFLEQKLYSDSIQQAVYIVLLSYGWYRWRYPVKKARPEIGYASGKLRITLLLICIIIAAGMGYFFDEYTDATFPYTDAAATSLSFAAQFLIARKKIENWWIWIVVNVIYVGIYMVKDLQLYAILFSIYLALAIHGLISWRKSMYQKSAIL